MLRIQNIQIWKKKGSFSFDSIQMYEISFVEPPSINECVLFLYSKPKFCKHISQMCGCDFYGCEWIFQVCAHRARWMPTGVNVDAILRIFITMITKILYIKHFKIHIVYNIEYNVFVLSLLHANDSHTPCIPLYKQVSFESLSNICNNKILSFNIYST